MSRNNQPPEQVTISGDWTPIPVDKNIAIPKRRNVRKYPWHLLDVGDSFFAPYKTTTQMHALARRFAKELGHMYTCRRWEDGCRVWRIK